MRVRGCMQSSLLLFAAVQDFVHPQCSCIVVMQLLLILLVHHIFETSIVIYSIA